MRIISELIRMELIANNKNIIPDIAFAPDVPDHIKYGCRESMTKIARINTLMSLVGSETVIMRLYPLPSM